MPLGAKSAPSGCAVMVDTTCTRWPRVTSFGVASSRPNAERRSWNAGVPAVAEVGGVNSSGVDSPVQKRMAFATGFGVMLPRCL